MRKTLLITLFLPLLSNAAAKIPASCQELIVPALKSELGNNYASKLAKLSISSSGEFIQPEELKPKWIEVENKIYELRSLPTPTGPESVKMPSDLGFEKITQQDFKRFSLSRTPENNTPQAFYKMQFSEYAVNSHEDTKPTQLSSRKSFFFIVEKGKCSLIDIYAEEGAKQMITASSVLCADLERKKEDVAKLSEKFFSKCNIMKKEAGGVKADKTCDEAKNPHTLKIEGIESEIFEASCANLKTVNDVASSSTNPAAPAKKANQGTKK